MNNSTDELNRSAPRQDGGYGSNYQSNYPTGTPKKKRSRKTLWIILAIVALLVIAGAVLGGIFGSRAANSNEAQAESDNANGNGAGTGAGSGTRARSASKRVSATGSLANAAIIPTATDQYGNPMYPTTTGSAIIAAPTVVSNAAVSCGDDPFTFSDPSSLTVRDSHPVLFAPAYKWSCLPKQIAADSYMSYWNDTIFINATKFYEEDPVTYDLDGGASGSGVLDVARRVQLRVKHWAYAYKLSNDTRWVDRTWRELQTAAGNTSTPFGPEGDNWNTQHFLDVAEFTAAFAIAYDWLYDAWTAQQRTAIMWSIINLGLSKGLGVYTNAAAAADYSWWSQESGGTGNWNCVCNGGLIVGSLAIMNEDPTNTASRLLAAAVPNAAQRCAQAPAADGTWSETPNYWYFGTTGHVQMAAALLSATGSTQNLLSSNPGMRLSGLYHMYVTGNQGMFNYGDTGPNKYTATANGLMFYGAQYNDPKLTLFQRDRGDAPEPMSMMYYDPTVSGQFWNGLELDREFNSTSNGWVSMRSSWTDGEGVFVGMKSCVLTGHQTHGDLDAGDFVIDALGQRWAGELGNGDYLSDGYFTSEAQNAERWTYLRKRSEGQNVILVDAANQLVAGVPENKFETTGETQNSLVYTPTNQSTAYFTTDISTFYSDTTSAKRAIRLINGRRQILLQDEFTTTADILWRMHTNATVTLSNSDRTASLSLGGQTLTAQILSPSAASFRTTDSTRLSSDPALASGSVDQPNPGVTVLEIALAPGTNTISVLFNPQYEGVSANSYVTPPQVAIDNWSLTSHDA